MKCFFCNEKIEATDVDIYQQVAGWGRQQAHGSRRATTSNIEIRELGNEFAHGSCVRKIKRGLAPTQRTLL